LTRSQAVDLLNQMNIAVNDLDEQLQNLIDESTNASLQEPGPDKNLEAQIQALQKEIDKLKASLENEEATLKELTTERDLTWDNYNILSQKSSEVSIANKTAETEVVIATKAVPPEEPYSPKVLLNTVIGFALGLVVSSIIAFIKENLDISNQKEA
jgi:succinoglycan biosynthesis transport protein ExoP